MTSDNFFYRFGSFGPIEGTEPHARWGCYAELDSLAALTALDTKIEERDISSLEDSAKKILKELKVKVLKRGDRFKHYIFHDNSLLLRAIQFPNIEGSCMHLADMGFVDNLKKYYKIHEDELREIPVTYTTGNVYTANQAAAFTFMFSNWAHMLRGVLLAENSEQKSI